MEKSEQIKFAEDDLCIQMTQPAMIKGVPIEAFMGCIFISRLTMIIVDSIWYLLAFIPLFGICRLIVKNDANAFRLLVRYLETSARCMNKKHWGGSSTTPMKLSKTYTVRDFE